MAQIPYKLKDFTCFIDAIDYAGRVAEVTLPSVKYNTEDHRGGGMNGPVKIEMGIEALSAEMTLCEYVPGLYNRLGKFAGSDEQIVFRGSQERGTDAQAIVATMRGGWEGEESDAWKSGDKSTNKFTASLTYYKLEINGRTVIEIDLVANVFIIDGEDRLAARKAALGQ